MILRELMEALKAGKEISFSRSGNDSVSRTEDSLTVKYKIDPFSETAAQIREALLQFFQNKKNNSQHLGYIITCLMDFLPQEKAEAVFGNESTVLSSLWHRTGLIVKAKSWCSDINEYLIQLPIHELAVNFGKNTSAGLSYNMPFNNNDRKVLVLTMNASQHQSMRASFPVQVKKLVARKKMQDLKKLFDFWLEQDPEFLARSLLKYPRMRGFFGSPSMVAHALLNSERPELIANVLKRLQSSELKMLLLDRFSICRKGEKSFLEFLMSSYSIAPGQRKTALNNVVIAMLVVFKEVKEYVGEVKKDILKLAKSKGFREVEEDSDIDRAIQFLREFSRFDDEVKRALPKLNLQDFDRLPQVIAALYHACGEKQEFASYLPERQPEPLNNNAQP